MKKHVKVGGEQFLFWNIRAYKFWFRKALTNIIFQQLAG
jgi:hypothetical protein